MSAEVRTATYCRRVRELPTFGAGLNAVADGQMRTESASASGVSADGDGYGESYGVGWMGCWPGERAARKA